MILAAAVVAGCVTDREEDGSSLGVGDRCPEFSVMMMDGREMTSAQLKGDPALICFFNTACGDCRQELPVVQQAYERLTAEGEGKTPYFICIARSEGEASIAKFWIDNSLTLPVAPQSDAAVYRLFATIGIPRIYVISTDGIITAAWDDNPMATSDQICTAFRNAR